MTDYDAEIVAGFRRALDLSGRTIRSVSVSTGIPYRSLQNYLSGTSKMPAAVFLALCEDLGVNSNFIRHGFFGIQPSTVEDALWRTLGETVLHGRPTGTPLHLANLASNQRKLVGVAAAHFAHVYDAIATAYIGELGAEISADQARFPSDDNGGPR